VGNTVNAPRAGDFIMALGGLSLKKLLMYCGVVVIEKGC
jgi:hypothetical protein